MQISLTDTRVAFLLAVLGDTWIPWSKISITANGNRDAVLKKLEEAKSGQRSERRRIKTANHDPGDEDGSR